MRKSEKTYVPPRPRKPPKDTAWVTGPLNAWSRRGGIDRPAFASGRRFVIVHLDGVSRTVLSRAMQSGYMPCLERMLDSGELQLSPAWSGAPASTPAFQASLFYGNGGDCPGYQWYDKQRGKEVRMDDVEEALRLEESLLHLGPGLLEGGSIYFSIIAGGASDPAFAMSRMAFGIPFGGKDDEKKNGWDHLATLLAHAIPFAKAGARMAGQALPRTLNSLLWSIEKGSTRHEARYMLNRMLLAELAQQVAAYFTALDVARGVPAIYTVCAGYDEVAHRRGPLSEEAFGELREADDAIALIRSAILARPELRYDLYILADHGQEPTRPVEQVLGGASLTDWILATDPRGGVHPEHVRRYAGFEKVEGSHPCVSGSLQHGGGDEGRPPLMVAGAGDMAHVYLAEDDRRAPQDLDAIVARWPHLLESTVSCPASGIVVVRGGRAGFAFAKGRRFDLAEKGSLEGVLPYDGEVLRSYLADMAALPSSGDLIVFGAGAEGGDVAYAWEFGSHGGVGVGDVETFVIHPPWVDPTPFSGKGPLALHRFFRERYQNDRRSHHEGPHQEKPPRRDL